MPARHVRRYELVKQARIVFVPVDPFLLGESLADVPLT
jgi:hypothetical protein